MKFKDDIHKEIFVTYGNYCTCGKSERQFGYYCKSCGRPLVEESLESNRWQKEQLLKVIKVVIEDTVEDYNTGYNIYLRIHKIINDSVISCDATKYSNKLFNGEKLFNETNN